MEKQGAFENPSNVFTRSESSEKAFVKVAENITQGRNQRGTESRKDLEKSSEMKAQHNNRWLLILPSSDEVILSNDLQESFSSIVDVG